MCLAAGNGNDRFCGKKNDETFPVCVRGVWRVGSHMLWSLGRVRVCRLPMQTAMFRYTFARGCAFRVSTLEKSLKPFVGPWPLLVNRNSFDFRVSTRVLMYEQGSNGQRRRQHIVKVFFSQKIQLKITFHIACYGSRSQSIAHVASRGWDRCARLCL